MIFMDRSWNKLQKHAFICSIWIKIDKEIACQGGDSQHVFIIGHVEVKICQNMFKKSCIA